MAIEEKTEVYEIGGITFEFRWNIDYEEYTSLNDSFDEAGIFANQPNPSWHNLKNYDLEHTIDLDEIQDNHRLLFVPREAVKAVWAYQITQGMTWWQAGRWARLWAGHQTVSKWSNGKYREITRKQIKLEGDTERDSHLYSIAPFYTDNGREFYSHYIPNDDGTPHALFADLKSFYESEWTKEHRPMPSEGEMWIDALKTYFSIMAMTMGWYRNDWTYVRWALTTTVEGVCVDEESVGGYESIAMNYVRESIQHHIEYIKNNPTNYVLKAMTELEERMRLAYERLARVNTFLSVKNRQHSE